MYVDGILEPAVEVELEQIAIPANLAKKMNINENSKVSLSTNLQEKIFKPVFWNKNTVGIHPFHLGGFGIDFIGNQFFLQVE